MATAAACNGCDYNYFLYIQKFYENTPNFIQYLQAHHVLPTSVLCNKCKLPCAYRPQCHVFYCGRLVQHKQKRKIPCTFSKTLFADTFLSLCRLPPWEVALYVNYYLQNCCNYSLCMEFLKWSTKTFVSWHNFCSEIMLYWLYNQESIGGPNTIVEIDHTFFVKIKCARGTKRKPTQVWLFGGIERESKKRFIFPVDKEDQELSPETLLPIIRKYIRKGSIVISDDWAAFQTLSREGYVHKVFNNPKNSRVHKRTIELQLKSLKNWSTRRGIQTQNFKRSFSRYLFLDTFPDNPYHQFFLEIAKLYKSGALGSQTLSLTNVTNDGEESDSSAN